MSLNKTPILAMDYLLPSQAQKHVTVNENLRALDILVQLSVFDRDMTAPPASPQEGDNYIIPAAATGAWAGHENKIAAFQDGAWNFQTPQIGWRAYIIDEAALVIFDGTQWNIFNSGLTPTDLALELADGSDGFIVQLGINTASDTTNRLALASEAALLTHDGDDMRLKLNKAVTGDTTSLIYQTGFTGHAELGLTGDDDFHIKVSPDGSTFHEAMIVDRHTGQANFPNTNFTDMSVTVLNNGSGTYVVPSGVKALEVTVLGAGGGGAGAATPSSSVYAAAGGGGAGAMAVKWISAADLAASYSYVVGTGGIGGGAPNMSDPVGSRNGTAGGISSFSGGGVTLSCSGGAGAPEDEATSTATQYAPGSGGAASGGDLNINGASGYGGITKASQFYQLGAGHGANSPFGVGGAFSNGNGAGGSGYGSGGAGAGMIPGFILNRAGGNGANGVIIVKEFYG